MSAAPQFSIENITVTPEQQAWLDAESAHNLTTAARQHLGSAVLALDAVIADDEAGSCPDRRDLARALTAVRTARSLLKVARGCTRPLVKATARRMAERKAAG